MPLITVMLAVFTAFPMFGSFQSALESLPQSAGADGIARPVLRSLTQFASKSSKGGQRGPAAAGGDGAVDDADDRPHAQRHLACASVRPIAQRILVYWAALTLGPLAVGGVSLSVTSYALQRLARAGVGRPG